MFTARSFSIRVLLVLCGTTQLVVWSGCSRIMSPPGQRLFYQKDPKAPDQYDWNLSSTEGEPSPDAADSMQANSKLDDQNSISQFPQEALQDQYAQSYQVPESVPPRLIPIESVTFPGDEAQEVVKASATIADQPTTRAALAVEFRDESTEQDPIDEGVKQAVLPRNRAAAVVKPTGPPVPGQQKVELPASPPQTKIQSVAASASSAVEPTSKEPRLNYNRSAASAKATASTNPFVPGEFQADRRATKPASMEGSPSDVKTSKVNVATSEKVSPKSVAPTVGAVANPSKLATEAKPSIVPTTSSAPTYGTMKLDLPNAVKVTESKPETPASSTVAQTPANPTNISVKTELTGDAALLAAGIKVDKNAFQISIPEKKKTESWKPKADAQTAIAEVQPKAKPISTPAQTGNDPRALTTKTAPAHPQISTSAVDATCATKQSGETLSSTEKSNLASFGTPASKWEGMTGSRTKALSDSHSPNVQNEKQASKATTSPAPIKSPAPITSQFAPTPTTALTSKPADPIKIFSPPTKNFSASNNIPKLPTANDQAKNIKALPAPANSAAESNSGQLAAKTPAVAKANVSLSELDLLDRNFPASTSSVRKQDSPSQTASNPFSSLATPIPSQFTARSPQLATLVETKPVEAPSLQLVNSQFCTEIKGFGQVTPFQSTEFRSNQRTLVYCEVENYNSQTRTTDKGTEYVTRFRGRYQIVDSKGSVVQSGQFPEIEDVTERKRRDFYLYFPITLKNLQQANYDLKLIIEESTPNSTGSESAVRVADQILRFTVK